MRSPAGTSGPEGDEGDQGEPGAGGEDGTSPWFTGAGLKIELLSATASGASTSATFRLTDAAGTPLDREGRLTEGAVAIDLATAWLARSQGEPRQYTPYVTREQASASSSATCHRGLEQHEPAAARCDGCHPFE